MSIKKQLQHKKKAKARKPKFIRQESNRRKRLKKCWRRPKGIQSKLRLRRRGKPNRVSIGYKISEKVRGLTTEGKELTHIKNLADLNQVKPNQIVIVARKLGDRKRLEILKQAKKSKIQVANFKNVEKTINEIKTRFKHRKKIAEIREKRKKQRKADKEKKSKMSKKKAEKQDTKAITKKEIKEKVKSKTKKNKTKAEKSPSKKTKKKEEKPKKPKPKKTKSKPKKKETKTKKTKSKPKKKETKPKKKKPKKAKKKKGGKK